MDFSALSRPQIIDRLQTELFDLVIIGGGVTGCGIALDAASRGLKVALVEKKDYASGTSSKSTKLIHGGLRYLKQLDINLVRETGQERAILNNLAPHLAIPEKMLLPIIEDGTFGKFTASMALWFYDFLAGVKGDDKRRMLSKKEALEIEPLLDDSVLKGAGYYAEYRTDDARLTIEIIKKAVGYGGLSINYSEVVDFAESDDMIEGVIVKDMLTEQTYTIRSKKVVSAAGPWVDHLRKMNASLKGKRLHLTKGVHIVVDRQQFPIKSAIYFDVHDGRMIFAIPRGKVVYIGTTDTTYHSNLDRVVATQEDRDYLLGAVNRAFPEIELTPEHVESNWAGLRPLIHEDGKSPSEISRKDEIFQADNGLISIAGGKLTGYRKMAEKVVDLVCDHLKKESDAAFQKIQTHKIQLTDDAFESNAQVTSYILELEQKLEHTEIPNYYAWYLVTTYGKQCESIIATAQNATKELTEKSLLLAELEYTIQHELTCTIEDFFVRRTSRLYFDIHSVLKYKDLILTKMKETLGWDGARFQREKDHIEMLIQDATTYYESESSVT